MKQLTAEQITGLAPNPAAAANGQKISQKGGFVRRECSADGTFFLGECSGSGKSNYITTADFIDPDRPVFRCSCPSRQFPCKHSLALLYEIAAGKAFAPCDIPDDILEKRRKKQAREEKAEAHAGPGRAKAGPARSGGRSAQVKKLKKQLEGLDLTARLVEDLLRAGLGTMGGTALDTYRTLSKQLGDYYLPGPQRWLNRLILEIAAYQKDGNDAHYDAAVQVLERLWTLVRKSKAYLAEKLEHGDGSPDASPLYEELGGIWKLADLESLGLVRRGACLVQLSFWVQYDEARGEYIDTGCWADIGTGEIGLTQNYRPLKALKYVRQDDTVFSVMEVPAVCRYPGEGNCRIRWEGGSPRPLVPADLAALAAHAAAGIGTAAKEAKNILKNTLSAPMLFRLVRYAGIGRSGEEAVLLDAEGAGIVLRDMPGMEPTVGRLCSLPDSSLFRDGILLGGFWYDGAARRLCLQPLSIAAPDSVVRLLY